MGWRTVLLVVSLAIMTCMILVIFISDYTPNDVCPKNGEKWDADVAEDGEVRCILRCPKDHVPSNCHVIRPLPEGRYNKPVPYCEKAPIVASSTVFAVGTGIAAILGAPYVIAAAGWTGAGVAASSIASWLQGSAIGAGGWFSAMQSAGAAGLAATTKAGLGSLAYATSEFVMKTYKGCERE